MTQPPEWLSALADLIAEAIIGVDAPAPLGCHFFHNESVDQWEITLFPGATEIVGGRHDGRVKPSPFALDLARLSWVLNDVERFHWQTHSLGDSDDLGPHVSLEGTYEDHNVWLRILAEAPEQFPIGRRVDASGEEIEDLWSN
jgi:hypothetical protein